MQGNEAILPARTRLPRSPRTPLRQGPGTCHDEPNPAMRRLDIVMNEVTNEVKDLWEAQGVPYNQAWLHKDLIHQFGQSFKQQGRAMDSDWFGFVAISNMWRHPRNRDRNTTDRQHHMLHGMRQEVLQLYGEELAKYWELRAVPRFAQEGFPLLCPLMQPAAGAPAGAQSQQPPASSSSSAASHANAGPSPTGIPAVIAFPQVHPEASQQGKLPRVQIPGSHALSSGSGAAPFGTAPPASAADDAGTASAAASGAAPADGHPPEGLSSDAGRKASTSHSTTQPPATVAAYPDRAHLSPAIQALWRLREGTLRPRPTEPERVRLGIPPPRTQDYQAAWPVDKLAMSQRALQLRDALKSEFAQRRASPAAGGLSASGPAGVKCCSSSFLLVKLHAHRWTISLLGAQVLQAPCLFLLLGDVDVGCFTMLVLPNGRVHMKLQAPVAFAHFSLPR